MAVVTFPAGHLPSYGTKPSSKARVNEAKFGDAYAQKSKDGINNIETNWSVKFDAITGVEKDEIIDFIEAAAGVDVILWAPPGQSIQRFTCERWQFNPVAADAYDVSLTFEKDYGL